MPALAKIRFLGDEPHEVPLLGPRRVVHPDELVTVPAALLDEYAWPESLWRVEDDPRARTQATEDDVKRPTRRKGGTES